MRFLTTRLVFGQVARETISQPGIELPTTPFSLDTSPLSFGSLGSSRTSFPEVLNFNRLFFKLNWFICNYTKLVISV